MIKVYKNLPKGIQRSMIVSAVIVSFGLGAIFSIIALNKIAEDYLLYVLVFGMPTTIVIFVAALWIYSGFKDDKSN